MRHLRLACLAFLLASLPIQAHCPVNLINSSDRDWHLIIVSNPTHLRIRVESPGPLAGRHVVLAPGPAGPLPLPAGAVLSMEALGATACTLTRFHLADCAGAWPHGSDLFYLAHTTDPGSGRGQLGPMDPAGWAALDSTVRLPTRCILQILGENWPVAPALDPQGASPTAP